ncbi:MAG: hypothetical protein DRO62_01915 [Candidatus Altiarchaeales archaeon]|nr:MAG: hypothetical protein DRO62_01915 [Candidatus Altiarchaeales archaeon]
MLRKKIKRKLVAHMKITQPFIKWLIFFFGVTAGAIMSIPEPLDLIPFFIGAFIFSVFGQCGVRYINDFGDQDVDSLQEGDPLSHTRMVVKGHIHPYEALGVGIIVHVSGVIFAYLLLNWFFALMFGTMVVLSFMYSVYPRLKRFPFTPNVMIGTGYVFLPIVAGYSIYAPAIIPPLDVWVLALLCAIFAFGASISKDFMDMERDAKSDIRTLPVVLGERLAARVKSALFLIPYPAVGFLTVPNFYPQIMLWSFLGLIPVGILVYKLITLNFSRERIMQWSIMLTWLTELVFATAYRLSVM